MKFLAAADAAPQLQRALLELPPLLDGEPLVLLPEQSEARLLLRGERGDRLAAQGERRRLRDPRPRRRKN